MKKQIFKTCSPSEKPSIGKGFRALGFSVAEAMVTLLIVSIALAAAAPIMSRRMISQSNNSELIQRIEQLEQEKIPSGMLAFFDTASCNSISGGWSEVAEDWQGRYPRIAGNYRIYKNNSDSFYDGQVTLNSGDIYEDAIRDIRGSFYGDNSDTAYGRIFAAYVAAEGALQRVDYNAEKWAYARESYDQTRTYDKQALGLSFHASYVVPTANENRVKTVGLRLCRKN